MTNTAAIKKITDEPVRKTQVIAVLETLHGENYNDCIEILELAKHFVSLNAMLDFELARDVINAVEIAGE